MSLSVGSLVKNGVVVGGNFTDSNNVVYGNTTVKAELDSLNQNLTLSYADTSYSGQQNINATLQAILEKVFPKELVIFNNGTFETPCDNGQYTYGSSQFPNVSPFVISGGKFTEDLNYFGAGTHRTLVTQSKIDFTNYSVVTVYDAGYEFTLDVSDVSGEYYLALTYYRKSGDASFGMCIDLISQKANTFVSYKVKETIITQLQPIAYTMSITKITVS